MDSLLAYFVLFGIFFITYADVSPTSCTLPSGALAPNATSCANTRDTASCNGIFSSPSSTDPKRDPKCVDPTVEDVALECANTCGLCCETSAYTCGDDPGTFLNLWT
uniref:ShKT domain-containing protein n=1 Tax=Panagrolaimus sp. PS1159 TaxID=55785 RepID=A0AC35GNU3_9BILA